MFAADLALLRKVADWRCVIRGSRAVCASVTAGIDLGWLVRAAIFGGVLIYVLARARVRTEHFGCHVLCLQPSLALGWHDTLGV